MLMSRIMRAGSKVCGHGNNARGNDSPDVVCVCLCFYFFYYLFFYFLRVCMCVILLSVYAYTCLYEVRIILDR